MWETFTALLLAHVLADFVFQTEWMIENKWGRGMAAHGAVVLALTIGAVIQWMPGICDSDLSLKTLQESFWQQFRAPLLLLVAHVVIDAMKERGRFGEGGRAFLIDQGWHFTSLVIVAALFPTLWAKSFWAELANAAGWSPSTLPTFFALLAGYILATRAGGFFVRDALSSLQLKPKFRSKTVTSDEMPERQKRECSKNTESGDGYQGEKPDETLMNAGKIIGYAERSIVFFAILAQQPEIVGFTIAAKGIVSLDFAGDSDTALQYRTYFIVGTLLSFAWAVAISYGETALLDSLGVAVPLFGA